MWRNRFPGARAPAPPASHWLGAEPRMNANKREWQRFHREGARRRDGGGWPACFPFRQPGTRLPPVHTQQKSYPCHATLRRFLRRTRCRLRFVARLCRDCTIALLHSRAPVAEFRKHLSSFSWPNVIPISFSTPILSAFLGLFFSRTCASQEPPRLQQLPLRIEQNTLSGQQLSFT